MLSATAVERPTAPPSLIKRASKWVSVASTLILIGAWFIWLRPTFLGGSASYVSVSGESMEPRLHTGDVVITLKRESYAVGDIVAYKIPEDDVGAGTIVIHRIIGRAPDGGYITQGDNREDPDLWRPTAKEISGSYATMLPQAGTAFALFRTPLGIAAAAALIAFFAIARLWDDEDDKEEDESRTPSREPEKAVPPSAGSDAALDSSASAVDDACRSGDGTNPR